jgi:pimeloyl-ACP methyl ester carboxylesterase
MSADGVRLARAVSADGVRLTRVVSADGVGLEVAEQGGRDRPTVVLIHGYPDTRAVWDAVAAVLGSEFHVVSYDVRGTGGSDAPRRSAAYDLARLGDDLLAVLDACAPGREVHLVGHDWGGIQGWEFATQPRFDGRLASFTAIAAPSLDQVALGRSLRSLAGAWRSWYIPVLLMPGMPTLVWRVLRPSVGRAGVHGAKLYRRNIPRRMSAPRRDAVARVPIQLIIPSRDPFISRAYYERATEHAPGLQRVVVEGGHWLPRERPEEIAGLVGAFARAVGGGGASEDDAG